jgi:hypothetical protein
MNSYKCNLCAKVYKLKDNFNKHYVSCKFFHDSCIIPSDENESLPTYSELYSFVKEIALKCHKLENEIANLKQNMNVQQKKHILDYLNKDPNNVKIPNYEEWCKSFIIKREHLQEVFEGDMISGIKSVLELHISSKNLPIRVFSQKHSNIYIYTGEYGWKLMQNCHFEQIIYPLERQFLQEFVIWQKENQEKISMSEKLKDDEIQYMLKICGSKNTMDKTIHILKKWFISKLEEEFVHTVVEF